MVSVVSASVDTGVKRSVYARAGVREYWVVRTGAGAIRVHREARDGDHASVVDVTTVTFAGAHLDIADLAPTGLVADTGAPPSRSPGVP